MQTIISSLFTDREAATHFSRWESLPAHEIVQQAVDWFGDSIALTVSFGGAAGMVLLDLAFQFKRNIPVLLIDTGVLFDQTYRTVERVEARYGIKVQRITPKRSLTQQAAEFGDRLWERQPDRCCHMRKVEPLAEALRPYCAWMTAVRREQTAHRADTPVISWNEKYAIWKVCPLAGWTDQRVWAYVHQRDLPYNPLLAQGYHSIGCHTCTAKPVNGDDRSGRWIGFNKTECGLHL